MLRLSAGKNCAKPFGGSGYQHHGNYDIDKMFSGLGDGCRLVFYLIIHRILLPFHNEKKSHVIGGLHTPYYHILG